VTLKKARSVKTVLLRVGTPTPRAGELEIIPIL
jgi:hypothetical protein